MDAYQIIDPSFSTQARSIRTWRAACGSVRISARVGAFAGDAVCSRNVETFFLQLTHRGALTVLVPYVSLDHVARQHLLSIVLDEIEGIDPSIRPCIAEASSSSSGGQIDGAIAFGAAIIVRACAATLRCLLRAAATHEPDLSDIACCTPLEDRSDRMTLRAGKTASPSGVRSSARNAGDDQLLPHIRCA